MHRKEPIYFLEFKYLTWFIVELDTIFWTEGFFCRKMKLLSFICTPEQEDGLSSY